MAQMRHWRQRFDKDAEFVFRRRMRLSGDTYTEIGQPVDKSTLGRHRLRAWWDANVIELAPVAVAASGGIVSRGGPWFDVTLPNGERKTVRGRRAAEALLSGE